MQEDAISKSLFALTLIAALVSCAAAQDIRISPPLNARDNPQAVTDQTDGEQAPRRTPSNPPFCPPTTCLYYAGDFDSTDSGANGLFNANDASQGLDGAVWVGVKPPKAATVTGATFNEFFSAGFIGTNPTPFQTQIGMTAGNPGTIVCNTTGNATLKQYGESDFGFVQYSYTIRKLAKACRIAKPSKKYPSTYVNLLPTSNNGYGYLTNVEDAKPKNHRGWNNDLDDCYYFCGPTCAINWQACTTQGTFDEFSIALTGKEAK